jgi:DnaJ-class molecular chaperone
MSIQTTEQLVKFVRQTYGRLDQLSYYELLGITAKSSPLEIRAAYYQLSNDLHPDRFYRLLDRDLMDRLETIYARICEGYRILTTPDKRIAYAHALAEGKKRLTSTDRESHAPQSPEDSIKHEESKKFFRLGMISLGRKDFKGAVMNFNFARSFEPTSPIINQKLAEAQAGLNAALLKPGGPGPK